MPNTLNLVDSDKTRRNRKRRYRGTLTGNYATGGEPLDLTAATDTKFLSGATPGGPFDL